MQLPRPIQAYFEADRRDNREALLDCFALSAIVQDEGHSYAGHQAIGSWWQHSKAKYQHMAEPLEAFTDEHGAKVLAKVTSEFAGSPVMLSYVFRLAAGKIAALEIGA